MHKKLTYVDKCHHEKTKIIQPSLHFLHQGFCKAILCGCQTFVLGKCPPGAKGPPCPNHIFLARPQSSCTLEGKRPAEHVQKWGGGMGAKS